MKILIVGLGAIGTGLGLSLDTESHLSVTKNLGYEIVGGVDLDSKRCEEFSKVTKIPVFGDLESAVQSAPDVIAIATNPESHSMLLATILELFPEVVVVCEKPFGSSGRDSEIMIESIKKTGTKLHVNFSRQFSKGYQILKESIHGNLVEGNVIYNHGLIRSCSHYIRLCLGIFGQTTQVQYLSKQIDPMNPSFQLTFENKARINFIGIADSSVRIADFTLVTDRETILIHEAMYWRVIKRSESDSPQWPRELEVSTSGDFFGGMTELYFHLLNGIDPSGTFASSLDSYPNKIIDEILNHAK